VQEFVVTTVDRRKYMPFLGVNFSEKSLVVQEGFVCHSHSCYTAPAGNYHAKMGKKVKKSVKGYVLHGERYRKSVK
jgi:hypothetical protein